MFAAGPTRAGPILAASAVIAAVLGLAEGPARADWPVPRADPQRTGAARGVSDLSAPLPYWRHYLGGAIGQRGALFMDVDGDAAGEVILVSGGKLVAKERDDALVWQTPVLGISELAAVRDLDGDGADEIVARSGKRVFIVEPATGQLLWQEPADDFGYLGGVRVGDLDGDGIDDLLVQECGCCRINNGNTGFMYSFADGFYAGAVEQRTWTMRSVRCGGYKSMAILDMDGDGRAEATESWTDGIALLDGATGEPMGPTLLAGRRSSESQCLPVDTDGGGDGKGAQELVCLQNIALLDDPDAAHRLLVIEYSAGGLEAGLQIRWQQPVGEVPRRVYWGAQPAGDLDGDGTLEIVATGVLADGERWVTQIFDAASGAVLADIADQRIVGAVHLGDAGAIILTVEEQTLNAWSFQRQAAAPVQPLWSLPEHRVIMEPDWAAAAIGYVADRILAMDLNQDGHEELILTGASGELIAYDVSGAAPAEVARFAGDASASILTAWATPAQEREPPRVLVAPSDGVMRILDRELAPVARGLRFGGYYPKGDWRNLDVTPVVADLGTGADSVVIRDSRGALVRLDARDASLAAPPEVAWSLRDASSPIIVPGLGRDASSDDGEPGIVCRRSLADGNHSLAVLDAGGAVLRSAEVGGQLISDLVPAQLDGDGVTDVIIEWAAPGDLTLRHRGYSGATLEPLWDAQAAFKGTTRFPAGGAVLDWNGDGIDDFVHQYYTTQVISGADGALLAESADNGSYFMPIVLDVDDDAPAELILQAGYHPAAILDTDLAPLWTSSDDDRPYPYGAVATTCPDGVPRLIEGSLRYPSRLKITELGGASMGSYASRVLAGGWSYSDEQLAELAGAFMGQLTSTSLHENLQGDGRPIAVVGSEDGWLYAVDACTGDLAFTVPFSASVGAVAFGDTDGDGKDEILVAVADGYLYALAQPPVRAPGWVFDIDPPRGVHDTDVDVLEETTRMTALWEAVPGADSYEIAIVRTGSGEFVTSPPWQPVGDVTRATVTNLMLEPGQEYTFAVRALVGSEPSPDAMSDGVVIELLGYPVGCTCNSRGSGVDMSIWLLLAWGLIVLFVRRRQQSNIATGANGSRSC